MLDAFSVRKPLYPLIAFVSSLCMLVCGMLFSKSLWAFAFADVLFVLYCCFGLFRGAWKMSAAMLAFGLVIGGLAFITNRNFDAFWQTVVRALMLGICAVPMITIPPADLTRCMNQLHCPRIITLGMLVTLRLRVRGANVKWYRPDCLYRAFFIPLVMRIIGISDTLSLSLETRAFALDNSPATVYGKVELRARDIICLVAVIISCAGLGVAAWMR